MDFHNGLGYHHPNLWIGTLFLYVGIKGEQLKVKIKGF